MKNIVVFGANSEISNSFVGLYRSKYNIYCVSRQIDNGDIGFQVASYSKEQCRDAIQDAKMTMGHIDVVLVFNGFGKAGNIGDIDLEQIDDMVRANLLVPYYVMHYISKVFIQQGFGHLLLV